MVAIKRDFLGESGQRWFDYADILVALSEFGGLHGYVRLSGSSLGSLLGISQQAASSKLQRACDARLVEKRKTAFGYEFLISASARSQISRFVEGFGERPDSSFVEGTVASGVGEGRFFLELQGYRKQFEQIYRFKPYPGTLNIKCDGNVFAEFKKYPANVVNGFRTKGRVFGLVLTYPARISFSGKEAECVALFPQISRYGDDMAELISHFYLRKKLGLEDGSKVTIWPLMKK